jgi:hypothetical protein
MYDYMFSADIFVEDMYKQTEALVARFGVHEPGPRSIVTDSDDAHAVICRLDRDISRAPTRLEIIQGTGSLGHWNGHHIMEAWTSQRERPVRFHNTVFVADDLEALAGDLQRRGVPTITDTTLQFARLWIGIAPDDRQRYDPTADAGLRMEVLDGSSFPIDTEPPRAAGQPDPGALVRVVNRSFIVSDLDQALATLERNLGWEPESPVIEWRGAGYREATLSCRARLSAKLLLREPVGADSAVAAFHTRWGDGPYAIGISVAGLEAKAEQLQAAGVPFTAVLEDDAEPTALRVGADLVGGTVLEFVEAENHT